MVIKVDPLAEWCGRELRVDIDGKILVLKPTMQHYRLLKEITKQKQIDNDDIEALEKLNKDVHDLLADILKVSYPDSTFIDDFLDRYEMQFQIALFVALGWGSKDAFEELKKKALAGSLKG